MKDTTEVLLRRTYENLEMVYSEYMALRPNPDTSSFDYVQQLIKQSREDNAEHTDI